MQEVSSGKAISNTRAKPTFLTIGSERRISTGQWNHSLMADHVILEGNEKPLPIGTLAKVAHGSGSPRNKKNVRRNLRRLRQELMSRGYLLLITYEHLKGAQFAKLYNPNSEEDRQTLDHTLGMMQKKGDLLHSEQMRARQIAEATNITDAA